MLLAGKIYIRLSIKQQIGVILKSEFLIEFLMKQARKLSKRAIFLLVFIHF